MSAIDMFSPDHVADVELRFVDRHAWILGHGESSSVAMSRVLQIRKLWREAEPIDARVSGDKAERWTEWSDVPLVAEREESASMGGVIPDQYPSTHKRYLLWRDGVAFTATPCYGLHEPWWVVRTLSGEAAPEQMLPGDRWTVIRPGDNGVAR